MISHGNDEGNHGVHGGGEGDNDARCVIKEILMSFMLMLHESAFSQWYEYYPSNILFWKIYQKSFCSLLI